MLMRSRTPPISSEFRGGGFEHPKTPLSVRHWFEQPFSLSMNRAHCFQVFIGGWGNAKTAIRLNRTKPDKALVDTPDILSDAEYRGFWVSWEGGLLEVGKEGETTAFVSWHDPEPFGIGYYGICTGWGASGSWIIEGE